MSDQMKELKNELKQVNEEISFLGKAKKYFNSIFFPNRKGELVNQRMKLKEDIRRTKESESLPPKEETEPENVVGVTQAPQVSNKNNQQESEEVSHHESSTIEVVRSEDSSITEPVENSELEEKETKVEENQIRDETSLEPSNVEDEVTNKDVDGNPQPGDYEG